MVLHQVGGGRCPFTTPQHLFKDFAAARENESLFFSDALHGWVVSRYDDIVSVLDRPDLFSSHPTVPDPPPMFRAMFDGKVPLRGTLIGHDNPDHDRLRLSVNSFFLPRKLQRFEPLMREEAHKLIDGFVAEGKVNIKAEFALPLPLKVIAAVVGIEPERWRWIGASLAFFGGHPDLAEGSDEEKLEALFDLHEHCKKLIEARRVDRRDDLISHIWNERDSGRVTMTDFEHLSMLPGLMLAGHETTTNLLSMGLATLLHSGAYDNAQRDGSTREAALEELLRYESAITGMPRLVMEETELCGIHLKAGDRVFVAYNSGSRDPKYFPDSEQLKIDRRVTKQHLGFGRGIHACLGAPLARLLLKTELSIINGRLPNLRLITSYEKIAYLPVGEGRGLKELIVAWDVPKTNLQLPPKRTDSGPKGELNGLAAELRLVVEQCSPVTDKIKLITLRSLDSARLPAWTPGSHIDLQVGPFGYRQYSLCSSPKTPNSWQIGVLRENEGTGGSEYVHENVKKGMEISTRGPRNHFQFELVPKYIFIAGGIGITPIKPMVEMAKANGAQFHLYYLGRSRASMAFCQEFEKLGDRATIWASDERGHFDLSFLASESREGLRMYCCGPSRLTKAVELVCSELPVGVLKIERFSNNLVDADYVNREIEVVMSKSGRILTVPPERSILDVLNEAGAGIISTCQKGTCGTCEVRVIEGTPEHRDTVLTAEERSQNKSMMACVSRCMGSRLTLDLW